MMKRPISTVHMITLVISEVKKAETLYPACDCPVPVELPELFDDIGLSSGYVGVQGRIMI
jgi:hypothetical protein